MRIHSLALFLKSDPMGNGNEITVSSSDASRIFIYLFFTPPTAVSSKNRHGYGTNLGISLIPAL
jgi:hypothetical protein